LGSEQDVTLGEIARAVGRIERKVDDQGETITSVNLRLTAIEAKQDDEEPHFRSVGKPLVAGIAGVGAVIYGVIQWIAHNWKTP